MDISRIELNLFYTVEKGKINTCLEFRESKIDAICRSIVCS